MLAMQELFCHNCQNYVQFEVDLYQDGYYSIPCPSCGHMHHRRVQDRQITDERWQPVSVQAGDYQATTAPQIVVDWATYSASSIDSSSTSTVDYNYYFDSSGNRYYST